MCPANDKILNLTKVLFYKKKNLICLCSWRYVQACLHCLCCHHAVKSSKYFVNLLVVTGSPFSKETSVCKQLMKLSYLMRSIWKKLWKPANSIPTKSDGTKWIMVIHCYCLLKKAFLPLSSCHYQWKTFHGLNETFIMKGIYVCSVYPRPSRSHYCILFCGLVLILLWVTTTPGFIWGPTQTSLPLSSRLFKLA